MRTDATPAATTITTVPLTELVPDWLISLDAGNKSSATIKVYSYGVNALLRWHEREFPAAPPVIDRKTVELWLAELRREGKAPATPRLWFAAMKLFTAWLADPDVAELERDPLARMKAPPAGNPSVKSLADADIEALLKACRGTTFADRRDKAMIYMLASTGMRAGELMALTVADVDVPGRTMWLGQAATGLGYQGAVKALSNRAQAAGVEGFHLHRFRHSFASRFKRKGGSDDELMSLAGWTDPAMARLYAADTASERARATALLMNLDTFD